MEIIVLNIRMHLLGLFWISLFVRQTNNLDKKHNFFHLLAEIVSLGLFRRCQACFICTTQQWFKAGRQFCRTLTNNITLKWPQSVLHELA